jgi:hypothetical protein
MVGLVVLALAGGIGYWYYATQYAPQASASSAILDAERTLKSASAIQGVEGIEETLVRSRAALDEARLDFAAKEYKDARFSALHSADLARQAISKAGGKETDTHRVRFYRIEGDVRVKRAGEFSWQSANSRMTLSIGDQVKTSSSASAQLIYFDGTVTTVKAGSLLEIRDLYEDPVTKVRRVRERLNWGEVKASTPTRNVNGSFHEVSTDKVSARSEEAGEFRLAYDRDKKTTVVDTFRGQIQVESGGKRESLVAGERIRARADGRLAAKQSLPGVPRLLAPADQRVFIFENPLNHEISLDWEQVAGAQRYHLMISDRPLFTDPLYDKVRSGTSAVLDGVAPGSYHWRAAAISPGGVEGPFSEPRAFRVSSQKIKDREDTVPPDLEITEFVTIGMMVIVNGRSEPGATLWVDSEKIDVNDDGRFYAVVRLRKEGTNQLVFRAQDTAGNETRLTKGAYVEMF